MCYILAFRIKNKTSVLYLYIYNIITPIPVVLVPIYTTSCYYILYLQES